MPELIRNLFPKIAVKLLNEEGQDLVEYSLIFAVVAFGSVAGMSGVAQSVSQAFLFVGDLLTSSIT
jgi:pilus assembly protein Flp/PilA